MCCCVSCCGVVVCFVFCPVVCGMRVLGLVLAPCCCPLLRLPGPLSWPVVVFCPWLRCCIALVCRLSCGVLLSASCLAGGAVLCRSRWLVLCVIACGCRCSLLGLVACCCFPLPCVVARAPAWPRGMLPCCVLWFVVVPRPPVLCPVFRGPVLPWCAVVWRPAVCFPLLVVLVCVLSLCVRCCVALRVVLLGAGLVCAVVGASCCGVSLCDLVYPLAFCGVVVLLWCVLVSYCAGLCSVVLRRPVVPWCWAVLCAFLLLQVFLFPLKTIFRFLKIKIKKKIFFLDYTLPNAHMQAGSRTILGWLSYV